MDEADWLASTDPAAMLAGLRNWPAAPPSDRKLRLFACACCRQVWRLLTDERSRRAVEVAERFADGEATRAELSSADVESVGLACGGDAEGAAPYDAHACAYSAAAIAAQAVAERPHVSPPAVQAALLRDLFGNPWKPYQRSETALVRTRGPLTFPCVPDPWLAWNDGAVRKMAASIYSERRFGDLPILADALEEAGCEDAVILSHCRGRRPCPSHEVRVGRACELCNDTAWVDAGPHARGCWVVDLLLGKE